MLQSTFGAGHTLTTSPFTPTNGPGQSANHTKLWHWAPVALHCTAPISIDPPPLPVWHSVGVLFLYGALDGHPFFPSHVASGRCVLSAAAAGAPAGFVSAFAEPSSWCVGAVLDVAGCAVCASAAPSSWRIGGCAGCCGGCLTVFVVPTPPSSGRPQPAPLRFRVREAHVPCSSTRCPPHRLPHSVGRACAGRVPCCNPNPVRGKNFPLYGPLCGADLFW